jgi:hypothetical protein
VRQWSARVRSRTASSFASDFSKRSLYGYSLHIEPEILSNYKDVIFGLCSNYLNHRFDLLGSGWVEVRHGMECRGLERYRYTMGEPVEADPEGVWLEKRINQANLPESKRIWRLISLPPATLASTRKYEPIDWHLDFKSGYRWSESTWFLNVPYAHKPGVDVKVPRELARMQHLPHLAWAFAITKTPRSREELKPPLKETADNFYDYVLEFRNQILDFIATNPPRFGVNWTCSMDVAIRVANWLVAYDLFRNYDINFDPAFETVFCRSVYEHARHIIDNLSWSDLGRSNHYLAEVVGIIFAAAHLPKSPETDAWLAFGVQELIEEVQFQFHYDGANFEGSTCYHRLSSELVIYGTALVLGLSDEKFKALSNYNPKLIQIRPSLKPPPMPLHPLPVSDAKTHQRPKLPERSLSPFPKWYFKRVQKMAEFTIQISKQGFHIPQIGDNDSGRFIKFEPVYTKIAVSEAKERYVNLDGYNELPNDADYFDEDVLDHRHLVGAINGLFHLKEFTAFCGETQLDTTIIKKIARGLRLTNSNRFVERKQTKLVALGDNTDWENWSKRIKTLSSNRLQRYEIMTGEDVELLTDLSFFAYPDFGLYIFKSKALYLAVRCANFDPTGIWGHSHNDNLGVELSIQGRDMITDPGTFLYTPVSKIRNRYRSVTSHFAPRLETVEPSAIHRGLFWLVHEVRAECHYFGERGFIGSTKSQDSDICRIVELGHRGVSVTDGVVRGSGRLDRLENIPQKISNGYGKQTKRPVCSL